MTEPIWCDDCGEPVNAPACVKCKGTGTVAVRALDCTHSQPCPCDHGAAVCPRCEGSKVEPCESCGEPSSHLRYAGDYVPTQPYCDECDQEEPRGDHPLGGMGYGYSYGRDR